MAKTGKVLVTGATGLLGSTLVPVLQNEGWTVASHGNQTNADYKADLTNQQATHQMLDAASPSAIINLVALTNVDQCEKDPALARRINAGTVENLASWHGMKECRLIHISTDHVYDGNGPAAENDVKIVNVYAQSKYEGEAAAAKAGATVLRTNIFGNSRHASRRSFSDWVADSLKAGQSITVFDDVFFSPLSFETLSRMISLVLKQPQVGVFNLGSNAGMSKADFAAAVAAAHGLSAGNLRRGKLKDAKLAAPRPYDMRMNVKKFEAAFKVALPSLKDEINGLGRT